jgi:hypothetical protein
MKWELFDVSFKVEFKKAIHDCLNSIEIQTACQSSQLQNFTSHVTNPEPILQTRVTSLTSATYVCNA